MQHFENMNKKHWFWAILVKNGQFWTIFGQKRANFEFSAKKRNCHFFTKPGLHEKNQKNMMRGFLEKVRTDGRTNGRESIGLQESRFLETKKNL